MSEEEKMRTEFEKWCSGQHSIKRTEDGFYSNPATDFVWEAWKAALSTRPDSNFPNSDFNLVIVGIKSGIEKARSAFLDSPTDFRGNLSDDDLAASVYDNIHQYTRPDVFSEGKFQEAIKSLGEYDDFSHWYLDEGNLRWFIARCVVPMPDVNQELVEALELCKCSAKNWIQQSPHTLLVIDTVNKALAKHKAGESAGFTEEELVEIIKKDSFGIMAFDIKTILSILIKYGALRVKGV